MKNASNNLFKMIDTVYSVIYNAINNSKMQKLFDDAMDAQLSEDDIKQTYSDLILCLNKSTNL